MIVDKGNRTDKQHLYRYQPFNEERMRIFTHNELFFCSPKDFNDPFDCKVDFSFEGCGLEDIKKFHEKALKYSTVKPDFNRLEKGEFDQELWKQNLKKSALGILQPETDKMGILCLSEKNDDILMWAHYADKHKGFCLQFDKAKLEAWKFCSPIDYEGKFLTFSEFNNAFPENNEKLIYLLLLRKSEHWTYESERRIIVNPDDDNSGHRNYSIPEGLLTGVIFGCQMTDDNKKFIENLLGHKKSGIQFYEAKKKSNEYALEIRERC
jgi:hypothetical protein